MDTRGNRLPRLATDRVAPFVAQPARHIDFAETAIAHVLHRFLKGGAGAALHSHLHDPAIPVHRRDELLALPPVMRARLFDVRVLACLARPDTHQRMPVVWRGNRNRIDGLVFQHLSHVRESTWLGQIQFFDIAQPRSQHVLIDVADRGDFHPRDLGEPLHVIHASAANSANRDANPIVCA